MPRSSQRPVIGYRSLPFTGIRQSKGRGRIGRPLQPFRTNGEAGECLAKRPKMPFLPKCHALPTRRGYPESVGVPGVPVLPGV